MRRKKTKQEQQYQHTPHVTSQPGGHSPADERTQGKRYFVLNKPEQKNQISSGLSELWRNFFEFSFQELLF